MRILLPKKAPSNPNKRKMSIGRRISWTVSQKALSVKSRFRKPESDQPLAPPRRSQLLKRQITEASRRKREQIKKTGEQISQPLKPVFRLLLKPFQGLVALYKLVYEAFSTGRFKAYRLHFAFL